MSWCVSLASEGIRRTMTPKHHIPDELLAAYAAGTCAEPESLFIVSHLSLCAACREALEVFEALGGETLDDVAPADVGAKADAAIASARKSAGAETVETDVHAPSTSPSALAELDRAGLPRVLAPYLREGLRWRFLAPGVKQVELSLKFEGNPVRLVRFPAGYRVPMHTHEGSEYTMVMTGAFEDEDGRYERGDVEVRDDTHKHELRITKDGPCICLFVSDAPPVPLTLLGRILRPFLD